MPIDGRTAEEKRVDEELQRIARLAVAGADELGTQIFDLARVALPTEPNYGCAVKVAVRAAISHLLEFL